MSSRGTCSIKDCGKPHFGRGWCVAHHAKWRKYGDPLHAVRLTPNGAPQAFVKQATSWRGDDCLFWPFARDSAGYGRISIRGRSIVASTYVCQVVHGPKPFHKAEAAHECGNGHEGCVNPRHLAWKTRDQNMLDMVGHGTSLRGTRSPHAKLTDSDVRRIRMLKGSLLQREIADLFDVCADTIGAIHRLERWAWLDSAGV